MSMGAFLFGALLIIAFTPAVFAQTEPGSDQDQALFQNLMNVYRYIQNNYVDPVDPKVLYDGAMRGMFESLKDPHTAFLDVGEFRRLNDTTTGEFSGVGIYIDKQRNTDGEEIKEGFVEVIAPIEGTPAAQAGILPGDLIAEIDGKTTTTMTIDDVLSAIRGKSGSMVSLKLLRGKTMTYKADLKRQAIEIPTVKYDMIGDVAYLRLIQFTPRTTEQARHALEELGKKGYKSLILDLRNNPGGVLSGAIEIANLFFNDGTLVSTKSRIPGENRTYPAVQGQAMVDPSIPIVVLINGGSASASEIVSGALKDRGRAAFIGEKSYGKGSVQTVQPLGDHGFRMTFARYYTPADICIDKIGIMPDIEVKDPPLTRDEEYSFMKLREKELITKFLDKTPAPSPQDLDAFIKDLSSQSIVLDPTLIKRLVKAEINRRANVNPVYDLEFDTVLQKALDVLAKGQVASIIKARPKTDPTTTTTVGTSTTSKDATLPVPGAKP